MCYSQNYSFPQMLLYFTQKQIHGFLYIFSPYMLIINLLFLFFWCPYPSLFPCVSSGNGKDIESSTCLRLPSCPRAVGLRQRPDGHEERVLHR